MRYFFAFIAFLVVFQVADRWLGWPREIVMRSKVQYKDGKAIEGDRVRTWRLEIPQEYNMRFWRYGSWLNKHTGPFFNYRHFSGSEIYSLKNRGNFDSIKILANLDPVTKNVTPVWRRKDPRLIQFGFGIYNGNRHILGLEHENYCKLRTGPRQPKILIEKDGPPKTKGCWTEACIFRIGFNGWPAHFSVNRKFLEEKSSQDDVCRIAREKLQSWTVHVDDLRVE